MPPLVSEGLNLAMFGMGTVFFFLTMLVLATMLMSRLAAPDSVGPHEDSPATGLDKKKLAAITAAIHQHRKN